MGDMNQWLQQQHLMQQRLSTNNGTVSSNLPMSYPSMPNMMGMPSMPMMVPIIPNLMPNLIPNLMPMPMPMPNLMPSAMPGFPGVPTSALANQPPQPTYTYERITVSMPHSMPMQTQTPVIRELEEGDSNEKQSPKVEEISDIKDNDGDNIEELDMELDRSSDSPLDLESQSTKVKKLKKGKKSKAKKSKAKKSKTKISKAKTNNQPEEKPERRMTRQEARGMNAVVPQTTPGTKTAEEALLELEHVPAGHMRASSKFHEEHLKREALNVLTIVASPECQRHLAMVARGEIQKNETQAGLGPFNLFKDLQTTLLDCLESYEVGANMKYNVLLPEAIIFSLMKIHNYSWEEAKTNFIEYSAIVEPCLESQE